MTELLIVFGGFGVVVALFFAVDWWWAGRLKQKLAAGSPHQPGTHVPSTDTGANVGAMEAWHRGQNNADPCRSEPARGGLRSA